MYTSAREVSRRTCLTISLSEIWRSSLPLETNYTKSCASYCARNSCLDMGVGTEILSRARTPSLSTTLPTRAPSHLLALHYADPDTIYEYWFIKRVTFCRYILHLLLNKCTVNFIFIYNKKINKDYI